MTVETECLPADEAGIARAAELIRQGQPVAVPTETVYGLAADATSGSAVARVYAAKGRPAFNPLIVHVTSLAAAERIAIVPAAARALADAFWPGPVTMVLDLRSDAPIAALATAGLRTIALRVPAHVVTRSLIEATGRPLAAPSANASGRISPTRAGHVLASLGGRIPLVLDGGPTSHGLESTIVRVAPAGLQLLRDGPVDRDALAAAAQRPLVARESGDIVAPGQLASHYAPLQPLRLNAMSVATDEWLIGFGPVAGDATLSSRGDLIEAAAALFDRLHEAERSGRARIAVAPIPDHGVGRAINDRLARAATPRAHRTGG